MAILRQLTSRQFVPLLFVPAGGGLLLKIAIAQSLPERLLALALLLFCPELARMAKVDLDNVAAVDIQSSSSSPTLNSALPTQLSEDSHLSTFNKILVSTVVLELLGFYAALASLQMGGIAIIFSQLWFNLLAKVQLFPQEEQAITSFGLLERLPVLVANAVGLVLLAFWSVREIRLGLSIALLILIGLFLLIKYVFPVLTVGAEQNASKALEKEASKECGDVDA